MAMFEHIKKNGIQLGNSEDFCFICCPVGSTIRKEHILENQEVFKLNVDGSLKCLCMKHLNENLGDYVLVRKEVMDNAEKDEDILKLPLELVKHGTEAEVIDYIEKAIKKHGY